MYYTSIIFLVVPQQNVKEKLENKKKCKTIRPLIMYVVRTKCDIIEEQLLEISKERINTIEKV